MGRLYERPRSPFLWADYYDGNGQRVRVSTGTAVAEGIPLPPRLDRVMYEQLREHRCRAIAAATVNREVAMLRRMHAGDDPCFFAPRRSNAARVRPAGRLRR